MLRAEMTIVTMDLLLAITESTDLWADHALALAIVAISVAMDLISVVAQVLAATILLPVETTAMRLAEITHPQVSMSVVVVLLLMVVAVELVVLDTSKVVVVDLLLWTVGAVDTMDVVD